MTFETSIRASKGPRALAARNANEVVPLDPREEKAGRSSDERVAAESTVDRVLESRDVDFQAHSGPYARWGKRLLNAGLLVVALPISVLVGFPIAIINALLFRDPRQVFYRQVRIGYQGRAFSIWKFRTMRDETPEGEFTSWSLGQDDSRVTRFGRFLRSTHLDELPQLINILAGEMDFIGPRPEMQSVHEWATDLIPRFEERTAMRPGITGLAQVTQGYVGCDEQAYRSKLAADLDYGRRLSLKLDIRILMRTVTWMLMGRGWSLIDVETSEPVSSSTTEHVSSNGRATIRPCPPRVSPAPSPATSPTLSSSSTTPALGTRSGPID